MIIQGQNNPIMISMSESFTGSEGISAVLEVNGKTRKIWTEMIVEDGILILPLTQEETMGLKGDEAILDIKFYKNGQTLFAKRKEIKIEHRNNPTIFEEDED